jgi:hypothetical protein
MWYSEELDIAFGAEPKTASRFLRDHLRDFCGFIEIGGQHHCPWDIEDWNRPVPYFSTVRHPGDHVFSWLWPSIKRGRFQKIGKTELKVFLLPRYKLHYPDKDRWFKHAYVQPRTEHSIMRYENLHEDFNRLLAHYGLPLIHDFSMKKKYSDPDKPRRPKAWREYWVDEAWEWFTEQYKYDFERFDYVAT